MRTTVCPNNIKQDRVSITVTYLTNKYTQSDANGRKCNVTSWSLDHASQMIRQSNKDCEKKVALIDVKFQFTVTRRKVLQAHVYGLSVIFLIITNKAIKFIERIFIN